MLREASTPASFMPERKEKSPFAANFSTKLGSVNNKLTCTLSCAADGDCGGGPVIIIVREADAN